jgi:PAS domain S-box-containing protein
MARKPDRAEKAPARRAAIAGSPAGRRKAGSPVKGRSPKKRPEVELQAVIAESRERMALLDTGTLRVLEASRSCLRVLGRSRRKVIGRPCYEVFHRGSRPCAESGERCPALESARTGLCAVGLQRYTGSRDRAFFTEVSIIPVKDGTGRVDRVIAVFRSIAPAGGGAGAEEAPKPQAVNGRARRNAPLAFLDLSLNYVWANQAFADIVGKDAPFFVGRSHFSLFPDDEVEKAFREHSAAGRPAFFHSRPVRFAPDPGRGVFFCDWSLIPITATDGTVSLLMLVCATSEAEHGMKPEEALWESEERFRQLADSMFGGVGITVDGRVVHASPRLAEMLGYAAQEMVGKPVLEMVAPASRDHVVNQMRQGGEKPYIHLALRKDGSTFPVEVHGKNIRFRGRVARITSIMDITGRMAAERALKESEERFRDLYERAPVAYFAIGSDGKIRNVNPSVTRLLGFEPRELVGRHVLELYADTPEGKGRAEEVLRRFLEAKEVRDEELEMRHRDGRPVWISLTVRPVVDGNGRVVESRSIVVDVTERKLAQDRLREKEEKYHLIVDNMADSVWLMDLDLHTIFATPTVTRNRGYTLEELKALPLEAQLSPGSMEKVRGLLADGTFRSFLAGKVRELRLELEFRIKTGGTIWAECTFSVVRDGQGAPTAIAGSARDITDRKRLEAEKRASEEKYRVLVENVNDVIYMIDLGGTINYLSPSVKQVLGYAPEELVGKNFIGLVFKDDASRIMNEFHRRLDGVIEPADYRMVAKDGELRWVRTSSRRMLSGGKVVGLIGSLTDITGPKRVEEALRKSEEKHRELVENLNDVIFSVGLDGVITYASPSAERVLGYRPEEVVGKSYAALVHQEDLPRIRVEFDRVLEGFIEPSEYRVVAKNGEVRWVWTSSRRLMSDGRVVGMTGTLTDLTGRKAAENALRASEEKYRELVENMVDALYSLDLDGRIIYLSPSIERLLGYRAADMVGEKFTELVPEEVHSDIFRAFDECLKGMPGSNEYRVLNRLGEPRWVSATSRPVRAGGKVVGLTGTLRDVTDRRRAEIALRESEQKYRLVTENLPVAIYSALPDERSTTVFLSGRMKELTGYSNDEFLADADLWTSMIYPDDRPRVIRTLHEHRTNRTPLDIEYRIITKDKALRWVRDKATPVVDEHGDITRIDGIMEDITARKEAAESLSLSEAKFRGLVDAAGAGVAATDVEGRLTYVNKTICGMTGYDEREVLGRPFSDFLDPDDASRLMELFLGAIDNPVGNQHLEFKLVRKDGGRIHCYSSPTPLVSQGEVIGFNAIITDISERKRAEEALAEEKRFSDSVIDTVPGTFFVYDIEGHIVRWNKGEEELLGVPPEKMKELDGRMFFHPDDREAVVRTMTEVFVKGSAQMEARIVSSDGGVRHFLVTAKRMETGGKAFLVGTGIDLTQKKKAEEALARAYEKLKAVDRMRTEFVDIAAHELRTPLTTIKLYLDLMAGEKLGRFTEEERPHLDDVRQSAESLNRLISEMLDFTKTESLPADVSAQRLDLREVARTVIEDFRPLAEVRGIRVELESTGDTTARFDAEMMRRAVSNLLSNAIKYCDEGGSVKIKIGGTAEELELAVADTGIGISETSLPHVFDRFFVGDTSLTRDRDRLGLGLPIVKNIIGKHGGRIWAESALGKGSTFYFTIPRSGPPADYGAKGSPERDHAVTGPETGPGKGTGGSGEQE